ncbi:haloacid dehalogenase [Cystobacter fuscus]|uniref:Haloacid dehalogenase n=1 Tax=Cystobacter fuscus TaxID=43 RepID=A0A250IWX8_9BACT|nr:CHAD domain-containing protein [Cystobacter fuscus]ATB35717.1 haloacid dehalogenase [Cystobacter fuscus]
MSPASPSQGLDRESRRTKAARYLLTSRLDDARRAEAALTRKLTPKRVHDLRVATRRLRAVLEAFRDLADLKAREREVKRLQDALGEVRDLHVQGAWLEEVAQKSESSRRAGFQAMHARLMSPLPDKERRLRRALSRWADRTVPALERETRRLKGPGKYGGQRVRQELSHRLRQLEALMENRAKDLTPAMAHALRKDVKKLRYEAELFVPALGREVKPLLKALKPLQESLGELHDSDVRLHLLQHFALHGAAAQRAAARTLLRGARAERAQHAARAGRQLGDWHDEKRTHALCALLE